MTLCCSNGSQGCKCLLISNLNSWCFAIDEQLCQVLYPSFLAQVIEVLNCSTVSRNSIKQFKVIVLRFKLSDSIINWRVANLYLYFPKLNQSFSFTILNFLLVSLINFKLFLCSFLCFHSKYLLIRLTFEVSILVMRSLSRIISLYFSEIYFSFCFQVNRLLVLNFHLLIQSILAKVCLPKFHFAFCCSIL